MSPFPSDQELEKIRLQAIQMREQCRQDVAIEKQRTLDALERAWRAVASTVDSTMGSGEGPPEKREPSEG